MYIVHVAMKIEGVLRARCPEDTITGAELLARCRTDGAHFSTAELDELDAMKAVDGPPENHA